MGVFEIDAFAAGTNAVARAVADVKGTTIIGGGDSIAAVKKAGIADRITHISTGGGASLEFLGGRTLPGVAALHRADRQDGRMGRTGWAGSGMHPAYPALPAPPPTRCICEFHSSPATGRCSRPSRKRSSSSRSCGALVKDVTDVEIVVAPPFTALHAVAEAARNTNIGVAAQDLYWEREGAFTGEVSPVDDQGSRGRVRDRRPLGAAALVRRDR